MLATSVTPGAAQTLTPTRPQAAAPAPEPTSSGSSPSSTTFPTFATVSRAPSPQTQMDAGSFTCTNDVCIGTGAVDFLFRTLQTLINTANAKIGKAGVFSRVVSITVDGRIDPRTVAAFLPVSRAVGGKLAIVDVRPDSKYLATNAVVFAQGIAQWLGITWVNTPAPGHWEPLRPGQVAVLPQPPPGTGRTPSTQRPPTSTPTSSICPPGTVATSQGCLPSPPPDQASTPNQPPPSSGPSTTPPSDQPPQRVDVGPTQQPRPTQQPGPMQFPEMPDESFTPGFQPPTAVTKLRYAGCIARFNTSRRVFSIYCPLNVASATPGLGGYGFMALGRPTGLGADSVTPPVPAGFTKVAETTSLPGAGETPAGEEKDKFFRLNNPAMWIVLVGTAAAVGGGGYWLIRRRRKAA